MPTHGAACPQWMWLSSGYKQSQFEQRQAIKEKLEQEKK